jgi:hypothetical protein
MIDVTGRIRPNPQISVLQFRCTVDRAEFGQVLLEAASDNQLHKSYKLEGGAAVFGLVRFSASTGQKCFT